VPPTQEDRYEPLPGLLGIPGFLLRKLSPRGRIVAGVVGALLFAGVVAVAVVEIPKITDTKRNNSAQERREQAAAQELQRRRLIAEQRPHRRVAAPALTPERRRALVLEVEAGITADARRRVRAGRLDPPLPRYATCERLPYAPDPPEIGRLSCTAVTSDIERDGKRAGIVGYPFRALIHYDTGRYAWCKVSGHAGEGSFTHSTGVGVPPVCGGRGADGL
jgi:hypothetical protein